jgi:hypothetical protein
LRQSKGWQHKRRKEDQQDATGALRRQRRFMASPGKCQYIPNSFVPVHPEQARGYNTPKSDPRVGKSMSKQSVRASVVGPW